MQNAETILLNAAAVWVVLLAVYWSSRRLGQTDPGDDAARRISDSAVSQFFRPFMLGLGIWALSYSLHGICALSSGLPWCSTRADEQGDTKAWVTAVLSAGFQAGLLLAAVGLLRRNTRIHHRLPTECGHGPWWTKTRRFLIRAGVRRTVVASVVGANLVLVALTILLPDEGFNSPVTLGAQTASSAMDCLCLTLLAFSLDWELNYHERDPMSTALATSLLAYGILQLFMPMGIAVSVSLNPTDSVAANAWFTSNWMPPLRMLTAVSKALMALSVVSLPALVASFLKNENDRNEVRVALRTWQALTRHTLLRDVDDVQLWVEDVEAAVASGDHEQIKANIAQTKGSIRRLAQALRRREDLPPSASGMTDRFDLAQTVRACGEARVTARGANVRIEVPEVCFARGDHSVAADAISRFMENALAANASEIALILTDGRDELCTLDIVDNGTGIADDVRPRLFLSKSHGLAAARYSLSLINADAQLVSSERGDTRFRLTFLSDAPTSPSIGGPT